MPRRRQQKGPERTTGGGPEVDADAGNDEDARVAAVNLRRAPSSLSRMIPIPPEPRIMPLRRLSNGIAANLI